ncbi:hypothetical protein FHS83_003513 [Rhizomicrobium palustre]|uniref:Uncharacterized protein n=1 Tax=Rhizomicrobium palustre TaxID=189966 RepID=A0A846N407_9PROT|nr:hypothetical protein [Rhizomicrobium palustre]
MEFNHPKKSFIPKLIRNAVAFSLMLGGYASYRYWTEGAGILTTSEFQNTMLSLALALALVALAGARYEQRRSK